MSAAVAFGKDPWLYSGHARDRAYLRRLGYPLAQNDSPITTAKERWLVGLFQYEYNQMVARGILGLPLKVDGVMGPATRQRYAIAYDLWTSDPTARPWRDIVRDVYRGLGWAGPPARTVQTVHTPKPAAFTLARMGQTARAAADTWTMRHWAATLAAKAKPKDYVGQLRQLYLGIVDRWRYVMEDGEWIHGTPKSLLGTVLGLDTDPTIKDTTRADVARSKPKGKGWGDCDDVSTLAASGVIALGMRPIWRVSRSPDGSAHVSTTVITPRGELVQLDPVGHPDHPFGWAQSGPGVSVSYFSLEGLPLEHPALGGPTMHRYGNLAPALPQQLAPQFYPGTMVASGPAVWEPIPYGFGAAAGNDGTYLGVLARAPRGGLAPYQGRVRRHFVAVAANDGRGPRVLACPGFHARSMMAGAVLDGTPATDQFGEDYHYSADRDLWLPRRSLAARQAAYGFGASRASRKAKRKARRRRTLKKIGRFFKKVGKGIRKVFSKIVGSKFVQTIVAGALQVFGVPMMLTKKLMAVASKFVGSGGFFKLFKGLRKNPKKVLRRLAKLVASAGRSDLLKGVKGLGGTGGYEPVVYEVEQGGQTFYAAPVEGIVGLDGAYGDAGEGAEYSAKPMPGYFYHPKKGESLSEIAKAAYGKTLPGAKWINAAAANAYATREATASEAKLYGPRMVMLLPNYSGTMPGVRLGPGNQYPALWIPPAAGVEPTVAPVIPDAGPEPADEEEIDEETADEEAVEPSPGPVPIPPAPPPDEEDSMVEDVPSPGPPPPVPVVPIRPDEADALEPEPEPYRPGMPERLGPIPSPYPEPAPAPSPIMPSGPPRHPDPNWPPGQGGGGSDAAGLAPILAIASLLLMK